MAFVQKREVVTVNQSNLYKCLMVKVGAYERKACLLTDTQCASNCLREVSYYQGWVLTLRLHSQTAKWLEHEECPEVREVGASALWGEDPSPFPPLPSPSLPPPAVGRPFALLPGYTACGRASKERLCGSFRDKLRAEGKENGARNPYIWRLNKNDPCMLSFFHRNIENSHYVENLQIAIEAFSRVWTMVSSTLNSNVDRKNVASANEQTVPKLDRIQKQTAKFTMKEIGKNPPIKKKTNAGCLLWLFEARMLRSMNRCKQNASVLRGISRQAFAPKAISGFNWSTLRNPMFGSQVTFLLNKVLSELNECLLSTFTTGND